MFNLLPTDVGSLQRSRRHRVRQIRGTLRGQFSAELPALMYGDTLPILISQDSSANAKKAARKQPSRRRISGR